MSHDIAQVRLSPGQPALFEQGDQRVASYCGRAQRSRIRFKAARAVSFSSIN